MAGIRDAYPRLPNKLAGYLACARPFTWLAPIAGVVCGAGMAQRYGYVAWPTIWHAWRLAIYGAATLLLLVVGNNFVNQSTDQEDAVNRTYRPIVRGTVGRDEASTIGHLLWVVAVLRAATLSVTFGVLVAALVAISYAYSHPPIRFKARLWWGNGAIAVARGGLGFLAAWSLWAPITATPALEAALVLTVFLVGATTAKDYGDVAGDAKYGVQTLPVAYGPWLATTYSAIWVLAALIAFWLFPIKHNPWTGGLATVCGFALLASMTFSHDKPGRVLEGNQPWAFMYVALLALQVALAF